MHQQIKQQWVEALRSGRYPQSRGKLRNLEGYCVLGVLCDLHSQATGTAWDMNHSYWPRPYNYLGASGMAPEAVQDWAGLSPQQASNLAAMNDDPSTFDALADYIDNTL